MNWSKYPHFTEKEFACKHTGHCAMQPSHMDRLEALRVAYNKPMTITSGYRAPSHPKEVNKAEPGEHTTGHATDVAVSGIDALRLVQMALTFGFTRIGVQQKGASRFIHLGDSPDFPAGIWSY